jgi:hypothetical protein
MKKIYYIPCFLIGDKIYIRNFEPTIGFGNPQGRTVYLGQEKTGTFEIYTNKRKCLRSKLTYDNAKVCALKVVTASIYADYNIDPKHITHNRYKLMFSAIGVFDHLNVDVTRKYVLLYNDLPKYIPVLRLNGYENFVKALEFESMWWYHPRHTEFVERHDIRNRVTDKYAAKGLAHVTTPSLATSKTKEELLNFGSPLFAFGGYTDSDKLILIEDLFDFVHHRILFKDIRTIADTLNMLKFTQSVGLL